MIFIYVHEFGVIILKNTVKPHLIVEIYFKIFGGENEVTYMLPVKLT